MAKVSLRIRTQSQFQSPTRRLVADIERACDQSRLGSRILLLEDKKQRSLDSRKKKLLQQSGLGLSNTFKPVRSRMSLFHKERSINEGLYRLPIRNIKRDYEGSRLPNFQAGSTHGQFFKDYQQKKTDKPLLNIQFSQYCETINNSDPKCRRMNLASSKSMSRKPITIPISTCSFIDSFKGLIRQSQKLGATRSRRHAESAKQCMWKMSLIGKVRRQNHKDQFQQQIDETEMVYSHC